MYSNAINGKELSTSVTTPPCEVLAKVMSALDIVIIFHVIFGRLILAQDYKNRHCFLST